MELFQKLIIYTKWKFLNMKGLQCTTIHKQLGNGFTIIIIFCNDEIIKLINLIAIQNKSFKNHFKMA
jgi:hypothetical protein